MNTAELCRRIGITQREIWWWCDTGVIRSDYNGRREWSFDETRALSAAIVQDLRRKGVSLMRIRRMDIREPYGDYLVVEKKTHLWCTEEELLPCVAEAPGGCLVVSLKDLRAILDRGGKNGSRKAAAA